MCRSACNSFELGNFLCKSIAASFFRGFTRTPIEELSGIKPLFNIASCSRAVILPGHLRPCLDKLVFSRVVIKVYSSFFCRKFVGTNIVKEETVNGLSGDAQPAPDQIQDEG